MLVITWVASNQWLPLHFLQQSRRQATTISVSIVSGKRCDYAAVLRQLLVSFRQHAHPCDVAADNREKEYHSKCLECLCLGVKATFDLLSDLLSGFSANLLLSYFRILIVFWAVRRLTRSQLSSFSISTSQARDKARREHILKPVPTASRLGSVPTAASEVEKLNPELLSACMRNDTETVMKLIDAGADPCCEEQTSLAAASCCWPHCLWHGYVMRWQDIWIDRLSRLQMCVCKRERAGFCASSAPWAPSNCAGQSRRKPWTHQPVMHATSECRQLALSICMGTWAQILACCDWEAVFQEWRIMTEPLGCMLSWISISQPSISCLMARSSAFAVFGSMPDGRLVALSGPSVGLLLLRSWASCLGILGTGGFMPEIDQRLFLQPPPLKPGPTSVESTDLGSIAWQWDADQATSTSSTMHHAERLFRQVCMACPADHLLPCAEHVSFARCRLALLIRGCPCLGGDGLRCTPWLQSGD